MINTSFDALAQKSTSISTDEKLEIAMKHAFYTLRFKRLAATASNDEVSEEQTRIECIDKLQDLFAQIKQQMGVKDLHLTVDEWKAQIKKVNTPRIRQNTTLYALIIYETGLCYL